MCVLGRDILQKFKGQNQNTRWNTTEEKVQKLKQSTCGKIKRERRKPNYPLEINRKEKKQKEKKKKILTNKNKVKEHEKKEPSSKIFQKN